MGFTKAFRESVPMLISMSGTSGSGKTFSGLLMAAGLAGPKGRVGMIDAENKRGSMYADDPMIVQAMPNGYEIDQITAPYSPARYIAKIADAEKAGITVCIIDSTSHEWEGEDGCCDIAEKNKLRGMPNWSKAKMEHKKFLAHCLSSPMHIIFCLRAREKVKLVNAGDLISPESDERYEKSAVIPLGIQPIAEKNFVFEMLLSLQFDEATHHARPLKVPKMLASYFPGGRLITKEDGERIRIWNESGCAADPLDQIEKRGRAAAEQGMEQYSSFFAGLSKQDKQALVGSRHAEFKAIAEKSGKSVDLPVFGSAEKPVVFPEGFDGEALVWNGKHYEYHQESSGYREVAA